MKFLDEQPVNSIVLCVIGMTAFSIFACLTSEWSILIMAGIAIFLLFYPLIKESTTLGKNSLTKQIFRLIAICALTCLALSFLITNPEIYPTAVTMIMAFLGVKLVFYPIYPTD